MICSNGAEDLVLVALHRRRGVIDQGRPQEKSLLMARQAPAPPVDDQLGALVDSQLDIAFNLQFIRLAGLTHVKTSPYYPESYALEGKIPLNAMQ
jgi:hypothetical protein